MQVVVHVFLVIAAAVDVAAAALWEFSAPSLSVETCRPHRTRRGRRLNFGYQREFQQHINPHGVGFQKIKK